MKNIAKTALFILLIPLLLGCSKEDRFESYYEKKCKEFTDRLEKDKGCDIVFLGDSITDLFHEEEYYPEYKTANRGINGDTTTGLLERMDISAYKLEPKLVYMLIGINNHKTIFDDYELLLKGLKENLPNVPVVIPSLTPIRDKDITEIVLEANKRIEELVNEYSYTFVDVYTPLTVSGDIKQIDESCFTDGLHPNKRGYQIMTEHIKPVIDSYFSK